MEVTSQSIRTVQFREKLRGYHPDDVDAFVADVARGVEDLERRLQQAESRAAEVESRQSATGEAEDSLRRTLVLAQRTADLAIQEAREEAAKVIAEASELRAAAEAEVAELRERLRREAEDEGRSERERLGSARVALLADVEALTGHVERERERLRIYFADQLRRVEEGELHIAPPPEMTAAEPEPEDPPSAADDVEDAPGPEVTGSGGSPEHPLDVGAPTGPDAEEDPFLAELRRAVTDERPLGPRDDVAPPAPSDDEGGDGFDLFAKGDDDAGRFGSRRRRRR
ncbi:MAG TPA: DivIVA domain-containing protein [Acidimicrobiales bacterium]|nr:DivIVA domain-containing protein [Acidimicrobiales bacterium]